LLEYSYGLTGFSSRSGDCFCRNGLGLAKLFLSGSARAEVLVVVTAKLADGTIAKVIVVRVILAVIPIACSAYVLPSNDVLAIVISGKSDDVTFVIEDVHTDVSGDYVEKSLRVHMIREIIHIHIMDT
jgi:hypothetical protein